MHNNRGFIKLIYIVVLCMFGVLLWLFWQNRTQDRFAASVDFDNALVDLLSRSGVGNSDVIAQSIQERTKGSARWVEYYREVRLPAGIDAAAIIAGIRSLSDARQLKCLIETSGTKNVVKVYVQATLLSHLLLVQQEAAPKVLPARPGRIAALVIDDVGPSQNIDGYLNLGIPVTFAILPHETYSVRIANRLHERGIPFILHLPMEPKNYPATNPGKGALLVAMSQADIRRIVTEGLASVPHAQGVSNHMGSAFTEHSDKMLVLARYLKEKDLFLFDSVTTQRSAARAAAKKAGLPFAANRLFLDVKDDSVYMRQQCDQLIKTVKKNGHCIAIGHVQKKHLLPVLHEYMPLFKKENITFVYLPEMLPLEAR